MANQQKYVREYRRYADTVAVLYGIYYILKKEPPIADYVGIERKLRNDGKEIEPDLLALYDGLTKGLIFEFKWSLPFEEEWLVEEIRDIQKYDGNCSPWKNATGRVVYHDTILVCHIEDSKRFVDKLVEVAREENCNFLFSEGFTIWTWIISSARQGERKEHLILQSIHGNIRNAQLREMVNHPPGLILPEEVLTFRRSSFNFIHQKPPVQYTIIKLIHYIFPQFQDYERDSDIYEITSDLVYEKSKILFPSWKEQDIQTMQVKRKWIAEALEMMHKLGMIGKISEKPQTWSIPIPTLKSRKPIEEILCEKLAKYESRATKRPAHIGTHRVKPIRVKACEKYKKLTDF